MMGRPTYSWLYRPTLGPDSPLSISTKPGLEAANSDVAHWYLLLPPNAGELAPTGAASATGAHWVTTHSDYIHALSVIEVISRKCGLLQRRHRPRRSWRRLTAVLIPSTLNDVS
jgi:hypothetical protein